MGDFKTLLDAARGQGVAVVHGDGMDILRARPDGHAGLVLTDPPYDPRTHEGARTNREGAGDESPIQFAPIDEEQLREIAREACRVTSAWAVMTLEYRMAVRLELDPPPGVRFVRLGIWDKLRTGAPQKSGDRPGMGWEAVAILHRADVGRMRWNGHGRDSVFRHPVVRGGHPTEKPVGLGIELVRLFSNQGDEVLDPFCGSGAFLEAAKVEGRRATGVELDEVWARKAARRLSQAVIAAPAPPRAEQAALLEVPRAKRPRRGAPAGA